MRVLFFTATNRHRLSNNLCRYLMLRRILILIVLLFTSSPLLLLASTNRQPIVAILLGTVGEFEGEIYRIAQNDNYFAFAYASFPEVKGISRDQQDQPMAICYFAIHKIGVGLVEGLSILDKKLKLCSSVPNDSAFINLALGIRPFLEEYNEQIEHALRRTFGINYRSAWQDFGGMTSARKQEEISADHFGYGYLDAFVEQKYVKRKIDKLSEECTVYFNHDDKDAGLSEKRRLYSLNLYNFNLISLSFYKDSDGRPIISNVDYGISCQ